MIKGSCFNSAFIITLCIIRPITSIRLHLICILMHFVFVPLKIVLFNRFISKCLSWQRISVFTIHTSPTTQPSYTLNLPFFMGVPWALATHVYNVQACTHHCDPKDVVRLSLHTMNRISPIAQDFSGVQACLQ